MARKGIRIGMRPSHPRAFIRTEVNDELGLNVSEVATFLGVHRATFSDLLNKKSSLTVELALRLEKAFQLNMDMLLRMQASHDATAMHKQAGKLNSIRT